MKRIGSNLRPADQKPQRNLKNIIVYTDDEKPRNEYPRKIISPAKANRVVRNIIRYTDGEKPRNDYPKKIVSPVNPSPCCSDENRELVGNTREVDGFKFCYKICKVCGHAVRYFYPAVETNDEAVREYRAWKRYMVQ